MRRELHEIEEMETLLRSAPVYQLPHDVAQYAFLPAGAVSQFRLKIASALDRRRAMDAAAFDDFFATLAEMQTSVDATAKDISAIAARLKLSASSREG